MKNLLIVLLSLVVTSHAFASDLGPGQASRVLSLLNKQKDGNVVYFSDSILSDKPPFLVQVSAIKFVLKPVVGTTWKQKYVLWRHPRFQLAMNDPHTGKFKDTIETSNLYILQNDRYISLRWLTRSKDDGSASEQDNSVLMSGCTEIRNAVDGLESVTTCNLPHISN